jgi:anti-anti-sigma factor
MATTDARGTRVRLRGRLDADASGRLRVLLEDAAPAVRLDLSRAADLPAAALRVLAAAHRAREGAAPLVIEQPSTRAARALRISGLDRVLVVERPAERVRPSGRTA